MTNTPVSTLQFAGFTPLLTFSSREGGRDEGEKMREMTVPPVPRLWGPGWEAYLRKQRDLRAREAYLRKQERDLTAREAHLRKQRDLTARNASGHKFTRADQATKANGL